MTALLRALLPGGRAARVVLLLAAALALASLLALGARSLDRPALAEREVERAGALVAALDAVAPERRARVAREASTRLAAVTVDPAPLVPARPWSPRPRPTPARRPWPRRPAWPNLCRPASAALPLGAAGRSGATSSRRSSRSCSAPPWGAARARARPRPRAGATARRACPRRARAMRAAARAFSDMQARIARFDAERMRTLSALGHDLRMPLAFLRVRAEMLDDESSRGPMGRTLGEMAVMADGPVACAQGSRDAEEPRAVDLAPVLRRLCEEHGAGRGRGARHVVRAHGGTVRLQSGATGGLRRPSA